MSHHIKIVQPSGILDSSKANQLRRDIGDIVASGVDTVLMDLREVPFMDSSGLGALVSALKTIRAAGGELYICSITDQVKMLFEMTRMDRVFTILSDQEEFKAKFQGVLDEIG
ncbi:hypothetical protein DO97_10615 [Neosynechococcus sphagnicola sy1]|uniref:Anti-sigma factor antagonist n=1 Tax=Neosynechococcus sphagnicola sy1 TaxID=1497020 RepID=A0A098TNG3_9CYAN|nr:STAS domain-containing protein [Neosynechococcus sphagnicola]KGF73834.1 hypothetical protein DO97_10615 [Neosynechococcus sphagnicola sy1]